MKTILSAVAILLLAACATTTSEPGWTGSGAQPFDAALAECQAQAQGDNAALESCMAAKGWTRSR